MKYFGRRVSSWATLLTSVGMLFSAVAFSQQTTEGDDCRGNHNCTDDDTGGQGSNDSSSESVSESYSGSDAVADSASSANNSVATSVNFANPKSTTVRNVVGPDTPNVYPSAPCRIARSAGLSIAGGALSGGSSIEDPECTLRETARVFQYLGVPEIGLVLLCQNSVVITGRKDRHGDLEEGEAPIGTDECIRLVRQFQGDDNEADSTSVVLSQIEALREEQDRTEQELLIRVAELEHQQSEPPAPRVMRQTVQQPMLSDTKRAKLAALINDEEITE